MNTLLQFITKVKGTLGSQSNVNEAHVTLTSDFTIPNLQAQVTLLASSIGNESVRIVVTKVFADLIFLLDYLSLVDDGRQESASISERFSILDAVRGEANSLVDFIENHAMQCEEMDELLTEALDGSAYAIKHEVRRIFDRELVKAEFEENDPKLCGSVLHAQGVLTNCFQQCMISLARVFDDSLNAARLFHDWQVRRERSLLLCRDLTALIHLTQNENEPLDHIVEGLRSFREGSMHWLMYKDYHDYEALSQQVIESIKTGERPADLLNRLECYLETLLAHVKARAVLADMAFEPSFVYENVGISFKGLSESPAVSFA